MRSAGDCSTALWKLRFSPCLPGGQNLSAAAIIQQAIQQGIPLTVITAANLSVLQTLNLPADAYARITSDVVDGLAVVVPDQAVTVDASPTTAWFVWNTTTGQVLAQNPNGENQGIISFSAALLLSTLIHVTLFAAAASFSPMYHEAAKRAKEAMGLFNVGLGAALMRPNLGTILKFVFEGIELPVFFWFFAVNEVLADLGDPPVQPGTIGTQLPFLGTPAAASAVEAESEPDEASGDVAGAAGLPAVTASGDMSASWPTTAATDFSASALSVPAGTILGSQGVAGRSGTIALKAQTPILVSLSGKSGYTIDGSGTLFFYGPSESSLGVSGDWQSYTATVTGDASITLTVPDGALTLNGNALPAGTYTIKTSSATLSGSGATSSPNFAGTALITATNGTLNLGPGTGSLSVGGKPLESQDETTLDGYTGTINVSANGDGTDSVSLNGNAGNVLQVTTNPVALTTDQNTPIIFATNIQTSLADSYNLTANAPPGWTVTIDSSGNVTATPAPGLQSGTYPIQIIAESQTDSNLVAQTTVDVTIAPTQPGITLAVNPDPVFSVPYNGAQLPTAFRAVIQNLGPTADTYNLTFSNIPSGFTLVESATSDTVPAGQTGIVGLYLVPNPGQPIPARGTQLSFTVTATSATDPSITQTQTETFTVPAIDAVGVPSTPTTLNTIPGVPVTDTITITNFGNVEENNIDLTAALSSGLTISGLTPISSLAPGQSASETVTLTPDVSTPLNSTLDATITVTFGPSASPDTQTFILPVNVVVPGATELASAADAAAAIGNSALSEQLNNLSTALTSLVENPSSAVYLSESLAAITSIVSQVSNDPFLASFAGAFTAASTALGNAATPADIETALTNLGTAVASLATALTDEGAHGFVLSVLPGFGVAEPQAATTYQVDIQNNGSAATTYDFSVSGLPAGVSGSFNQSSVTLQPGQSISGGTSGITLSLTETGDSLVPASFTVTATAAAAPEIKLEAPGRLALRNESILVAGVLTNPPFTNAGGQVDVSAKIQTVVNEPKQIQVSYSVADSNGNLLFTSSPVTVALTILSSLTTVDLGNLDTTGFAEGGDTITVTVENASGNPIPGATGQGTLTVGSPITANITVTPTTLPTGTGTVTNTLEVDHEVPIPSPLSLDGTVTYDAPESSVALWRQLRVRERPGRHQYHRRQRPDRPSTREHLRPAPRRQRIARLQR